MKHFKILTTLALVFMAGIAMCSQLDWLTVQSFTSILPHAGNFTYAEIGTVVTGGVITQQSVVGDPTGAGIASDPDKIYLDAADVEQKIQLYKPYQTPILTYVSQNGVGTTTSYKKDYYAIDARGMSTTIVAVDTTLTSHVVILEVADGSIFTQDNTVFFTEINTKTTKTTGRFLIGIITAFPSTNHITVKLLNDGNANADADFTNGMKIYRGPTASHESSASTTPWGGYPEMDYNYVQFFQEQVQMSELQQLNKKVVDWNFGDVKRMAIEDFKIQKERAFLAGTRAEFVTTVNNKLRRHYSCGGFLNDPDIPYLGSQTLSGLGSDDVTGWLKTIFAGNNGSKQKVFLGGADIIESIEKIKSDNKWMTSTDHSAVLGVDIVSAVSTFGKLEMMYYEQLDLLGMPKTAIVLDKEFLKPCVLAGKGFTVRDLDLKKAGLSSDSASVIEEWVTMLIMNKKAHHIIQGV